MNRLQKGALLFCSGALLFGAYKLYTSRNELDDIVNKEADAKKKLYEFAIEIDYRQGGAKLSQFLDEINKRQSTINDINEEARAVLVDTFSLFDKGDNDEKYYGLITTKKLGFVMGSYDYTPTKEELQYMINVVDTKQKGSFTSVEMILFMINQAKNSSSTQNIESGEKQ